MEYGSTNSYLRCNNHVKNMRDAEGKYYIPIQRIKGNPGVFLCVPCLKQGGGKNKADALIINENSFKDGFSNFFHFGAIDFKGVTKKSKGVKTLKKAKEELKKS